MDVTRGLLAGVSYCDHSNYLPTFFRHAVIVLIYSRCPVKQNGSLQSGI